MNTVRHKIEKYADLKIETERQWNVKTRVLSIVISTTGVVSQSIVYPANELEGEALEIRATQKAAILHTTNIVQKIGDH